MAPAEDQGIAYGVSPATILYVRDGTGKWSDLFAIVRRRWEPDSVDPYLVAHRHRDEHTHGRSDFPLRSVPQIQYDGTNLIYSGCTTYNSATSAGANNFGGGNCEKLGSESATAFLGLQPRSAGALTPIRATPA